MTKLFSIKYTPKGRKITFFGIRFTLSLQSPWQRLFRPLISVIVPVYNVEKYLPKCLESLSKQTFFPFEIICINDGSTDHCLKILRQYAAKDKRIHIINQNNRGLSAARNTGLSHAKGQYILFVDSDDYLHPEALTNLYHQITRHDADICIFGYQSHTNAGLENINIPTNYYNKKTEDDVFTYHAILWQIFYRVSVWTKLYRRAFINKKNITFPEGYVFEDIIFHIKTIISATKICLLNQVLYYYRLDNNNSIMHLSATNKKLLDILQAVDMVYNYLQEKKLFPSLQRQFCLFIHVHITDHLQRAVGENKVLLAQKMRLWLNNHEDIRHTMDTTPDLSNFYNMLQSVK